MLTHLTVTNVAITAELAIDLQAGTTVITGETGAGKSVLLEALGLTLGDRADAGLVRQGCEQATITAAFDISNIDDAKQWLQQRDLLQEGDDCLLRRTIHREGRSRAYINGCPVTLQELRQLGEYLIDIHSQHAHQALLRKEQQRQLLDDFADNQSLLQDIQQLSRDFQQRQQQLQHAESQRDEQSARAQLLGYQLEELDNLAITGEELAALEQEQSHLANGEELMKASQHALAVCTEGELNAVSILNQALQSLQKMPARHKRIEEAEQLLSSALIQTEEAASELEHYLSDFELDPQRLHEVEQRLNTVYEVARKHRVKPEQLPQLQAELQQEYDSLSGSDEDIANWQLELQQMQQQYRELADKLSQRRQRAASKLEKALRQQLAALAMENCRCEIALTPRSSEQPHPQGQEDVQFLVSTNPGQAAQALAKIASGGELSRISLAIQVITAKTRRVPTLVFDEVDVGIGGATAEVVGKLLRDLGENCQVLCVTHQAQVAARGHQHLFVHKQTKRKQTQTGLQTLSDEQKIEEIARMMGGVQISEQTLAHAREMLRH